MSCDKHYHEGHLSISSSGKLAIWCLLLGSINPSLDTGTTHRGITNTLLATSCDKEYKWYAVWYAVLVCRGNWPKTSLAAAPQGQISFLWWPRLSEAWLRTPSTTLRTSAKLSRMRPLKLCWHVFGHLAVAL